MATKLFRTDSFQRSFDALVVETTTHKGKPAVILDQTGFYPSAGGQPNDTGIIAKYPVTDVVERDDGEIIHVLDTARDTVQWQPGDSVHGSVFWPRRWDHMQQHSGQHVLSAAFVRACGLDTLSVHISADYNTLDLGTGALTRDHMQAAEDAANQCIFDNRLFKIYEVSDADLPGIPLRKAPKVSGLIRIVEIDGFDFSACGGTHVGSAGQIGQIKIERADKKGNETRVTFRCGVRALAHHRALNDVVGRLGTGLNVGLSDLETQVSKMRDESKSLQKQLAEAQALLLRHDAAQLIGRTPANADTGIRTILATPANHDMIQLRALAKALCETSGIIAILGSLSLENNRAQFCFARSANLAVDVRPALKLALGAFSDAGAKGGGSADLAQGSAPTSNAMAFESALDQARAWVIATSSGAVMSV